MSPTLLLLLAGCGAPADSAPVDPIDAVPGEWTWVDAPGATCADGTATGFGINLGSQDLLLYLGGGGACWDAVTCALITAITDEPRDAAWFARNAPSAGLFDRDDPDNPFAGWTQVYVPYCTGDLHAGTHVATYGDRTMRHVGHDNLAAFLPRLVATLPDPDHLGLVGTSAGGGGTLLDWPLVQAAWPDAPAFVVDDSMPLLVGDDVPADVRHGAWDAWGLDAVLGPTCGAACRDDLSGQERWLARTYPDVRFLLLGYRQDHVVRGYFRLTGPELEAAWARLQATVLDPEGIASLLVDGDAHTMLGDPGGIDGLWAALGDLVAR